MLAIMAGPSDFDTGQFLTFMLFYLLPYIICFLLDGLVPKDPTVLKNTMCIFLAEPLRFHRGTLGAVSHKKISRRRKPRVSFSEGGNNSMQIRAHLFPFAMTAFRIGCRIEIFLCRLCNHSQLTPRLTALNSAIALTEDLHLCFDSDSYKIRV